jgi:hypothetical protein
VYTIFAGPEDRYLRHIQMLDQCPSIDFVLKCILVLLNFCLLQGSCMDAKSIGIELQLHSERDVCVMSAIRNK